MEVVFREMALQLAEFVESEHALQELMMVNMVVGDAEFRAWPPEQIEGLAQTAAG